VESSAPPATTVARVLTAALLLTTGTLLAGCGVPPELAEPPSAIAAPTATPSRTGPATTTPGTQPSIATPTATRTFEGLTARDCQGRPTGAQVIDLLRRSDLLPRNVKVTVEKAPVCAGSWQYTVVRVADHEPLQVVSKGQPTSLDLVTAGTNVCSIPVRVSAPPGIRTRACG